MNTENEEKTFTWADLKTFCNSIDEVQLKQSVKIFISDDETPTDVNNAEALGDDYYYFPDHEYSCTKSDYDRDIMRSDTDDTILYNTIDEALQKEEHFITPANRIYLYGE